MNIDSSLLAEGLRRGEVFIPVTEDTATQAEANVVAAELLRLGFLVHPGDLLEGDRAGVISLVEVAREVTGADRDWAPVYKNFPAEVREMPLHVQYANQIIHYLTGGEFFPESIEQPREELPLGEMLTAGRRLKVTTGIDGALDVLRDMVVAPVAMSNDDLSYLVAIVNEAKLSALDVLPLYSEAKNRENAQHLVARFEWSAEDSVLYIDETNHVDGLLRFVLGAYGYYRGNASLVDYDRVVRHLSSSKTSVLMLHSVPTTVRKAVVRRLGELTGGFRADALVNRRPLWRRVLNPMHPVSNARTVASRRALDIIFENIEYRTFASLVDEAFENADVAKIIDLHEKNIAGLLRIAVRVARLSDVSLLAAAISDKGRFAPLTTLISAYNGISDADSDRARVVSVAGFGNTLVERTVDKIGEKAIAELTDAISAAISQKFADREMDVIGTADSDYPVSLVARDKSSGDRELNRGQVIGNVQDTGTIRFFQHWNNNTDSSGYVDGGVNIFDGDFNRLTAASFNHHGGWATYSGDTHVSPGSSAVEFYDVVLDEVRLLYPEAKWLVYSILSFSGIVIDKTDIFAGVSVREHEDDQKGAIWDPRTVAAAARLTTQGLDNVVLAVSVETGDIVWIDTGSGSNAIGQSAINIAGIPQVAADAIGGTSMTWAELAVLAASGSGATVDVTAPLNKELLLPSDM